MKGPTICILLLINFCLCCYAAPTAGPGPKKVAFFAGLLKNFGPVSQDTDFVFDNVGANVGLAYNVKTGRFTAPVRATYQFSVTIAAQQGQAAGFSVLKNGNWAMTVWATSVQTWSSSSGAFAISLAAGDQIWLQVRKSSYVYGYQYTSFTGFLIFEN
jgi:hypothetical protein